MTFTSSQQGVIGTATVTNGTATLTSGVLPVGSYSLTATYTGDTVYAGSASTSNVTISVSVVTANILATVSPTTQVPYGATVSVTATVTLPGTSAAPSGAVSAQVQGVTGAIYSATLSPNPGNNSSTANISLSVPSPGIYTLSVSCAGNTNFQCQTPINLPFTSMKGNTSTSISVTPAAPRAGQPISLTAVVANSGNGTGTYVHSGSVSFYDSGKLIGTAPVATNQATTTLVLSGNRTRNITATYTGDTLWSGSTSVAVIPSILPSAINLISSVTNPNGALDGLNVVLTGTVSTSITYNSGPTGIIAFYDTFNVGFVQLGSPATLTSSSPNAAIGLFNSTGLFAGTHSIYAVYSGDDNYAPATSAVLVLKLSDFSLTMTPSVLSLTQGKSAQATASWPIPAASPAPSASATHRPPAAKPPAPSRPPRSPAGAPLPSPSSPPPPAPATPTTRPDFAGPPLPVPRSPPSSSSSSPAAAPRRPPSASARRRHQRQPRLRQHHHLHQQHHLHLDHRNRPADPGSPLGTQNFTITASGTDGTNTVRHTYQYQVTIQ